MGSSVVGNMSWQRIHGGKEKTYAEWAWIAVFNYTARI